MTRRFRVTGPESVPDWEPVLTPASGCDTPAVCGPPTRRSPHYLRSLRSKSSLLTTVIIAAAVTLMLLATVLGLAVHRVLRLRSADDRVWAEAVSHRLTAMGNPFQTTRRTQIRGSIAGRTAVLARAADGRIAAVVTLHVPLAKAEGPRRPDLRLPRGERDHRFGPRWVQVWTKDTDPSAAPPLLARALALAQAAEEQQTAPWALFAGQQGLAFRASREGEPCAEGAPVGAGGGGVEAEGGAGGEGEDRVLS